MKLTNEELYAGREPRWAQVADFVVPNDGDGVQINKLLVQCIGNPSQITLGRAGPDNVEHDHFPPAAVTPGQTIGHISARGYEGHESQGGREWERRSAQIYFRYWEDAAGSIHFEVRRGGGEGPDDTMLQSFALHQDGRIGFLAQSGRIAIRDIDTGRTGSIKVDWD